MYRQPSTTLAAEQYSKNLQDKTTKVSPEKQSIMEYSPGLPQDTKPFRSWFGNIAKKRLKSHLGIKCQGHIELITDGMLLTFIKLNYYHYYYEKKVGNTWRGESD